MKIGIDGTTLAIPFFCGTKSYSKNLIFALSEIDKKNDYYIFAPRTVQIPKQNNFHLVKTPTVLPVFKRQFFISYYAKNYALDVFHYLNSYGDIFLNHPNIVTTVHDTGLDMTFPYFSKYFLNRLICEVTRASVFKKSKILLTGSSVVKKELEDIKKTLNINPNIYITPYGVDDEFLGLNKTPTRKKYIMCMGDFSLRKNIYMCLKAFSMIEDKYKTGFSMLVVSSGSESTQNFNNYIKELHLERTAKVLTNISRTRLKKLYRESFCFLFPSLYEGFGFPILEAMSSGTPVITSNFGAMKEVAGNSAIFVDPRNQKQIANALTSLIKSKKLQTKYTNLGFKHARQFTWRKTAVMTLKIYNTIVK